MRALRATSNGNENLIFVFLRCECVDICRGECDRNLSKVLNTSGERNGKALDEGPGGNKKIPCDWKKVSATLVASKGRKVGV